MAKDPAVLWYFGDWQGGTITLSRQQKGCYMDLLCAQFNSGPLSPEEIETVLGNDFAAWQGSLSKKFKKNGEGMFYNERLQAEMQKRRTYSESRKKNLSSKPSFLNHHMDAHMGVHMENKNKNRDINKNTNEKTIEIKNENEKKARLVEFEKLALSDAAWVEAVCRANHVAVKNISVRTAEFNSHVMAGGIAVSNPEHYQTWFRNWLLTQNYLQTKNKSAGVPQRSNVYVTSDSPYWNYCPDTWDEAFYKRIENENYASLKIAAYEQKLRRNGYRKQGDGWVK